MEFEITPQRAAYLQARGKVILNACPGSGKTTCIIQKLIILLKECHANHGAYAGIACLSFTNSAKDEIQHKYKEMTKESLAYPHKASTIDSFINQYITLPYFNLLNENFKRPKIIDNTEIIQQALTITYWKEGKQHETLQCSFTKFKNREGRSIHNSYPPGDIWIEADGSFTFKGKKPNPKTADPAIFQAYGQALFDWKLKNGYISSLDSAYLALKILKQSPRVGRWLAKRFPVIIIDEAQDNSGVQHALFDQLFDCGHSHIELIGDPYQSLYEWRDAKPHLFLAKYNDPSWQGLPLSQNRRSTQRIIDCFSIVRMNEDEKIISKDVQDLEMPVTIYRYHSTNSASIVADFEKTCTQYQFKKYQVVVRGNEYKRKMIGTSPSIDPWKHATPMQLLAIQFLFYSQHIKEAIDDLRKLIAQFSGKDYHERRDLIQNNKDNYAYNGALYRFLFDLPSLELSLETWAAQSEILLKNYVANIGEAFQFKKIMAGQVMKTLKQKTVKEIFTKSAREETSIQVSTIHQVKGATLDAILYFFDENSDGTSVSFTDFKQAKGFPTEKKRIIYVACSRPQHLLAMAFPMTITPTEIHNTFGDTVFISPV